MHKEIKVVFFFFSLWINAWWWILLNIIICNRIKSSRKFHTFPFKYCNCFLFSSFFCLTLYLTSKMKHNRDLQNISSWGLEHKTQQRTRHGVKSLTLAASVQASNFIKVNSCYATQHVWCPLRMKTSVIAVILFGRWRRVICWFEGHSAETV